MRHLKTFILVLLALTVAAVSAFATPEAHDVSPAPRDGQLAAPPVAASPRLPLSFVANAGQFDAAVRFYLRYGRQSVWVGAGEVTLSSAATVGTDTVPLGGSRGGDTATAVRMRFVGASPEVEVEGRDRLPGVAHFYRGNDPERWITGVATYAAVAQVDLYPGITQIYHGSQGRLKSEFRVAPGADPAAILMEYSGARSLAIDASGELVVRTASGEWRESVPVVFQQIDSRRSEVPASFRLLGQNQVGFAVGSYDPAHELVIDPTLHFSTFLGGTQGDSGGSIAVDGDGNVVVCGTTTSTDFPLENEINATNAGNIDLFVAKLDFTGSVLLYSTYLGGSGRELGGDVAVDGDGNAYCVGWTASSDFPTTAGVFQPAFSGIADDAAVVKLSPTGTLLYSTYLGSNGDDQPEDIAVDSAGHAYVVGNTNSASFPTTPGAFSTSNQGIWDVFVTKLDVGATGLMYSTYLGGSGYDEPMALALDSAGNAYVTGRTQSSDFPVTAGVYDPSYNGTDTVFLTKLDALGNNLLYSTFLDGISPRFGARQLDVAVDSNANAYVAAPSEGNGFPATSGAYDETFNGVIDVVVMKVNPTGIGPLVYSTFLGGSGDDRPNGIAVDASGGVYVTGSTTSTDFPLADALSGSLGGVQDVFVARLSPAGDALPFASYLGGSGSESANAIALAAQGPCLTGFTASTDFPTAAPPPFLPYQPNFAGGANDAFVTCIDAPRPCPEVTILNQTAGQGCLVVSDQAISQSIAENFVLNTGVDARLTRLRFTGAYLFNNVDPGSDSFEVNVYADNAGLPAASPEPGCSQSALTPLSRNNIGVVGNFDIFEFTLGLSGNCVLQSGGSYWLEIFETGLAPDHFSWQCGTVDPVNGIPDSASASQSPGVSWASFSVDTAVTITAELVTCGTEACLPPPPGMVYWAPFDETFGNTTADLVAGNNGTHMDLTIPVSGMVAGALDLVDGYVEVPHASDLDFGTGNFSLDFWIREPDYPPLGTVVAKHDSMSNQGFEVYWDICLCTPGFASLFINLNGVSHSLSNFSVPENTALPWTHIVIVVDRVNQLIHFYVDGTLRASVPISIPQSASVDNSEPLLIGKAVDIFSFFSGMIDELELFNRALTAAEATDLFTAAGDGKCKDRLHVPWDKKFCLNAQDVVMSVEVCNYSTTQQHYNLTFAPLPVAPKCSIPGPVVFEDAVTGDPPPLAVWVPAQTCIQTPVRIERPLDMVTHNQIGCYQVVRENLATGGTRITAGSVQDKRKECAVKVPPVEFISALSEDVLVVPTDGNVMVTFELGNTTATELAVDYLIDAMPDRVDLQPVVSLDEGEPGVPITGSSTVPPGGVVGILVNVMNTGAEPFAFYDIVISTDTEGQGDLVPLASASVRSPLPTEAVVANQDQGSTPEDTALVIAVATNDFGLASPLDLSSTQLLDGPANGTSAANGDGSFTYTPAPGFNGADAFTYEICDSGGQCDTAAVSITVTPTPPLFADGFESGDTSAWSSTVGGTP